MENNYGLPEEEIYSWMRGIYYNSRTYYDTINTLFRPLTDWYLPSSTLSYSHSVQGYCLREANLKRYIGYISANDDFICFFTIPISPVVYMFSFTWILLRLQEATYTENDNLEYFFSLYDIDKTHMHLHLNINEQTMNKFVHNYKQGHNNQVKYFLGNLKSYVEHRDINSLIYYYIQQNTKVPRLFSDINIIVYYLNGDIPYFCRAYEKKSFLNCCKKYNYTNEIWGNTIFVTNKGNDLNTKLIHSLFGKDHVDKVYLIYTQYSENKYKNHFEKYSLFHIFKKKLKPEIIQEIVKYL